MQNLESSILGSLASKYIFQLSTFHFLLNSGFKTLDSILNTQAYI